ncbi:MAG: ABC transporter permease [Nonomuraea sp.]|nr:ABC transporter permease [Nonomuraea sp.]
MRLILTTETRLLLRDWPPLIFVMGLPLALLLLLGSIPTFSQPTQDLGGQSVNQTHMPAMMTMLAMMTLAFTVLPTVLTLYRERGILRRISTTPASPMKILTAQLVINVVLGIISTTLLIVCGRLVLGTAMPKAPLWFALTFVLGSAALMAMGLVIAAVSPTAKATSGIGSVVMFPLMFVAGMWLPREQMPEILQRISDFSIAGPFGQGMRDAWAGNPPQLLHVVVLVVGILVFGGLAVRLFRWE